MKHTSSIISFTAVAVIAAFGTARTAFAAPEQIGCYGDNWGPTLERLEPVPVGPLTFKALRCMPIPEGWPRFLPPSLSPNGDHVFAFGYTKGLWLGDVTRGGRAQIVNEKLPGNLLSMTAPFAWLDDSTSVIGVKRDVAVPSGFSLGPLRPYLFNLDGSQEKLPALVHPNGPLDEIYWLNGSGLALAAFATKGNYYRPEHEDSKPTLALVDARHGTIRQSVEKNDIPELADQKALGVVASRTDGSGKIHVLLTWMPGKWLLWVEGQPPRVVPIPLTTQRTQFSFSSDASSVLIMGNLSATGRVCEFGNTCPPPTPQSGMIAELRDVLTGHVKWTLSGTASNFSQSLEPAVSPDGRYGLISMPDDKGDAIALISMDAGTVIQKFREPGWGPIGLSFTLDGRFAIITGGTVMATFAVDE